MNALHLTPPVPITADHEIGDFDSGEPSLNEWRKKRAQESCCRRFALLRSAQAAERGAKQIRNSSPAAARSESPLGQAVCASSAEVCAGTEVRNCSDRPRRLECPTTSAAWTRRCTGDGSAASPILRSAASPLTISSARRRKPPHGNVGDAPKYQRERLLTSPFDNLYLRGYALRQGVHRKSRLRV